MTDNSWLKAKGYIHLTPQFDIFRNQEALIRYVKSEEKISTHAFFPLIYSEIKERRYKKVNSDGLRGHSFKLPNGDTEKTFKTRPIHYATHIDSLIFGYYASVLQNKYEQILSLNPGVSESVTAYRKIPIPNSDKNKSTVHFAKDLFDLVKYTSKDTGSCGVLTVDVKSFFSSLDHNLLKQSWKDLLGLDVLPKDHYQVFKACTRFSYVMKSELQKKSTGVNLQPILAEKRLAKIRNHHGITCLFSSVSEFRNALKSGELKVYRFPFSRKGKPIGIPQGLPISAMLANLYLLNFDRLMVEFTGKLNGHYRRYSDDIVIVCSIEQLEQTKEFIYREIDNLGLKVSKDKTEEFHFLPIRKNDNVNLNSYKVNNKQLEQKSLTYLGFEFNGQHALIKSANLAKFYRRMIYSVKTKSKRGIKIYQENNVAPIIFRRQLYRLYSNMDLDKKTIRMRWKKIIKSDYGQFRLISGEKDKNIQGNYFSYIDRASSIMMEPKIKHQVRKHKAIFNKAIHKHFSKKLKYT